MLIMAQIKKLNILLRRNNNTNIFKTLQNE